MLNLRHLITTLALAAVLSPAAYAASSDKTFTVSNTGDGPLTITGAGITGNTAEFSLLAGHNCTTVAAGSSCAMTVRFTPAGSNARNQAWLNFTSNGTNGGVHSIPLSGAGSVPASCTAPWGGTVAHGGGVWAYASSSVSCGSSCSSQYRTCDNGTLSGSYTNSSCSVGACTASCTAPWGSTVSHGSSVTAYGSSSVPCGSSCASQTRTCNNGSLSGSYTNSSCSVQSCTASCSLPWGGTLAHGGSVTAYYTANLWCGDARCLSETRSCNNGSLSGSYPSAGCTEINEYNFCKDY
jgi:hypothetical protein